MRNIHFIYSEQADNGHKGGGGAAPGDSESKKIASDEGKEDASVADGSLSTGDLDGGGGVGTGLTGGDENAESGDKGPTPDKTEE